MATIKSTLALEDKMSATVSNIDKNLEKMLSTMEDSNKALQKFTENSKKATNSSNSFFKSMLNANLVTGAISKLFNLVTSGIDSAIKRYDTLNNYVNVMSNLGISEEEAEKSRERLANGLKGLPTTLDSAVLAVQRFTSANNNVEASTEMYLAMNNALLAGGTSAETQASAMEQLAQAYSKGKPDMMEWRAIQQAMPGQLQQIAKAMGKTTDELGKDLRSGKTSMNEFMKTVVKLNQEGIGEFKSFEEQAKGATGGIQTAIANMKSAISRGWTGMFEGANKALEASGLPNLQQIITNLGNTIEDVMTHIGTDLLPSLGQSLADLSAQFGYFEQSAVGSASQSLTVWDYFMIGFNAVKIGILTGLGYLQLGLLNLKLGFQGTAAVILTIWQGLATGIQAIVLGIISILQALVNRFIDGVNAMIDVVNVIPGVDIEHKQRATWAEDYAGHMQESIASRQATINGVASAMGDTVNDMDRISGQLRDWQQETASGFLTDLENKMNKPSVSEAKSSSGRYDPNNIDNLANTVGTDSSGGKAVKTTTNDDLLKDEDIQLLLDVATRDYKLNYQQVTPNITLTFGDIRETADVDDILDQVADRLEEIYDSNLEVATV